MQGPALLALACATLAGDPLAGLHPYVLPWREEVQLLTCRWRGERPVTVALPEDATADERRSLRLALSAWEQAGLGLRFAEPGSQTADIQVAVLPGPVAREGDVPGAGRAVVDCLLGPGGRAELASARVEVARAVGPDWRGRMRPLSAEELAGTAFHELGHALGFQGHARWDGDPLARSVDGTRRAGARLLRGHPASSPALRALYALPSGSVLRRTPVSRWRTDDVDRMAVLAEGRGFEGPFLRIGDATARIFWRDARGEEYGLLVLNVQETLRDATRILVVAEPPTRRLIPHRRPGSSSP